MRLATLLAAMRRGCVWPIRPRPPGAQAAAELERDLGQLGGLARAGLAADDDHRMRAHGARDLLARRSDSG
jgi:uncharacterized membrane protein YccC